MTVRKRREPIGYSLLIPNYSLTWLLTILSISKLLSWEKHAHQGVHLSLSGGARGRVIPSSIPNLEVKPPIADNTAGYAGGNVGRCHFEIYFQLLTFFYNQALLTIINHFLALLCFSLKLDIKMLFSSFFKMNWI